MKHTVQTLIFQFEGKRLSDVPRIAQGLLNEGKEILMMVAKRQEK